MRSFVVILEIFEDYKKSVKSCGQIYTFKHIHQVQHAELPAPSVEFLWASLHSLGSKSESNLKRKFCCGLASAAPCHAPLTARPIQIHLTAAVSLWQRDDFTPAWQTKHTDLINLLD